MRLFVTVGQRSDYTKALDLVEGGGIVRTNC